MSAVTHKFKPEQCPLIHLARFLSAIRQTKDLLKGVLSNGFVCEFPVRYGRGTCVSGYCDKMRSEDNVAIYYSQ